MSDKKPFNQAFSQLAELKQDLHAQEAAHARREAERKTAEEEAKQRPPPPSEDDATMFARAMRGVEPLEGDRRGARQRPAQKVESGSAAASTEAADTEAMIHLASTIDADAALEPDPDGELHGALSKGLDRKIYKRLKKGELAVDRTLDLHGLRRAEAERALGEFLKKAVREKARCVLIVTGQGHNSESGEAVLKPALVAWLGRGRLLRFVLAYCVAQPADGGLGAFYVLLRRAR